MGYCSKCGASIAPGASFCNSCGARCDVNYGQEAYDQPVYSRGRAVKTDRSLIMYILLSIVTCGIYGFVFIHSLAEDANEMCAGDGETTAGLGMYILLSFVTCGLYSIYWYYKLQNRFYSTALRYGAPISETGTTFLLWYIIGSFVCGIGALVAMNMVISSANRVGTAYNMKYVYGR